MIKKISRKARAYWSKSVLGSLKPYRWHPAESKHTFCENFGDSIFEGIYEKIVDSSVAFCDQRYGGTRFFVGGSTLHMAKNCDWVWGAGLRGSHLGSEIRKLSVLAVRGPMTAEVLRKRGICCPEVYGDPAILAPLLFPELGSPSHKHPIGFVPHFSEFDYYASESYKEGVRLIDPRRGFREVIQEILECDVIISSSLHGLILGEAYGIPAIPLFNPEKSSEPTFKFEDYYSATNRSWNPHANFSDAVRGTPTAPPLQHVLAKTLLASFPRRRVEIGSRISKILQGASV